MIRTLSQREHVRLLSRNEKVIFVRFSVLRLQCLNEQMALFAKQHAIYLEDCQRAKLVKRDVPTQVYEIADPKIWSPQGILLGHVHVHNGKITRSV